MRSAVLESFIAILKGIVLAIIYTSFESDTRRPTCTLTDRSAIRIAGRVPRVQSPDERYLGDIYISPAYVTRQCSDAQLQEVTTLADRLPVLVAHGLCHLMGYDHERDDDYEQMQKAETYLLRHYPQFLPRAFAPAPPATAPDVV
ncbi:unnamed protein product [Hyaloperonospora brassicae]|uniref:Uncharacterized protein n=1 Tax=Hyaloperonospora brassicae TaxID=162125 RepID=A0AAV0THL5_HYABA|nr:unnamed protein product [Hyaloperonospora brassicae]